MTFRQWCNKYNRRPRRYGRSRTMHVFVDGLDDDARWELHHLLDWKVAASVSGNARVLWKPLLPMVKK